MIKDRDIGYILHKAAMLAKNNFTNKLNAAGLTPGQFLVLKEIYYHQRNTGESGLSPACIADRLECDRPTISGIIDRLENQNWIGRIHNPGDKRSYLITLTDKAVGNLKDLEEIASENQNKIIDGFTEEEIMSLKNYLLRIVDNFKEIE